MHKAKDVDAKGFSLIEVLIVLLILSFLSAMMILAITGARRLGTAMQANSVAQAKNRFVNNILERDLRLAGVGIYESAYKFNNDGKVNGPEEFNYTMDEGALEGYMVPAVEVINGTDTSIISYFNPFETTIGLTAEYREPGTDIITIYQKSNTGFAAEIDAYNGLGQEHFDVEDMVAGEKLLQLWEKLGKKPIMVVVFDDEGQYATMRVVTDIKKDAKSYNIKMSPSNEANQPSNMKGFFDSAGIPYSNDPQSDQHISKKVAEDTFSQVSCVSYFVYRHPNPDFGANGWLVRLDMPAIAAGGLLIDATDPETIRPFVISENVSDFQVALGIDSDASGVVDIAEWRNDEVMESYIHANPGQNTVSADYIDFVNNLRAIRFSVVTYTDETSANDRLGFADPAGSKFSTFYPTVDAVADFMGITATLEDHAWTHTELVDRLWYHRAVQITKVAGVRNMDLENLFAREQ